MKGIILAGGQGSRLSPLTDVVNKFLLPIYNKTLIEYSIDTMVKCGITDIAIILGRKSAGQTIEYLKSGERYGVNFTYLYQENPLGVAHALKYAKNFVGNDNVLVLCADNIIWEDITPFVDNYKGGCTISCKEFDDVNTLRRFAVLDFDSNGKVTGLIEKPLTPPSNIAFAGIQIYDNKLFDIIPNLKLSDRGEYEITHVINEYIKNDDFNYVTLTEEWVDAGTPESLLEAQKMAFNKITNGGMK